MCGVASERMRVFNSRRAVPTRVVGVFGWQLGAVFVAGRTWVRSVLSLWALVEMEVVMGTSGVG
jgi:hypothetical protein